MVLWTPLLFYPFSLPEKPSTKRSGDPPLPMFLRKNVILKVLHVKIAQERESKDVTLEFASGAGEEAGAKVKRGNTRKITIDVAIMLR
jgi:hypothetical protein